MYGHKIYMLVQFLRPDPFVRCRGWCGGVSGTLQSGTLQLVVCSY